MKTNDIKMYRREEILDNLFTGFLVVMTVIVSFITVFVIRDINKQSAQMKNSHIQNETVTYQSHDPIESTGLESFKYITPVPEPVQSNSILSIENKYQYAMYDTIGERNDLTVDLLTLGDRLMSENNLDPNLLFGIIMVESEGHANKTNPMSGAAGLGQFMPYTGRFIYNTYIDKNSQYDHNTTPYNAVINLQMTAIYLDYLYDIYHGSTMDVLKEYCGGDDEFTLDYYNKICDVVGYCIN